MSDEAGLCEAHGIEFLSFPIKDRGEPTSIAKTVALVSDLVTRVQRGVAVAVHCRAGIGRSGLIVGCVMQKLGVPMEEVFPSLTRASGK